MDRPLTQPTAGCILPPDAMCVNIFEPRAYAFGVPSLQCLTLNVVHSLLAEEAVEYD